MIKQKKGFFVFVCSLVPGAGEMYMGFRKQGLSIMTLFWGVIALCATLNVGVFAAVLPVIWFYSFFNVHNLKSLTEEEFYSLKDDYAFHAERIIGNRGMIFKKYHTQMSIAIIIVGGLALWNCIPFVLRGILPDTAFYFMDFITSVIPRAVIGIAMVVLGIYLLSGRKDKADYYIEIEDKKEE